MCVYMQETLIRLYRFVLIDEQEKWYFAIVDVVAVLTEQNDY